MHNRGEFFDGLYVLLTWLMRFVIVNVLWFATNLPSVLLFFRIVGSDHAPGPSLVLLLFLQVLLFFPSVTALYTVVNQWLVEKDYDDIFKTYARAFLTDYSRSLKSGAIWAVIAGIWMIDYVFFSQMSGFLEAVILILGALLFCMAALYTVLFIQNDYDLLEMFKLSLRLTLTQPIVFLSIVLSFVILLWVSVYFMWFAIPFLIASVHAFIVLVVYCKKIKSAEQIR